MVEPKPQPQAGDPCPQCGGAFVERPAPSDTQRVAAADRDNPVPLTSGVDTAPASFRQEHGALQVCDSCGYQTRFTSAPAPAPAKGKGKAKSSDGDGTNSGDGATV